MLKYKSLLIALIIIVGAMSISSCARKWHTPEKRAEWMVKKISKELDLNDDQKAKLNKIKDEIMAKRQEFKGMRTEISDEVISQFKSDKIDEAKLNQLFDSKADKMKEMKSFMISKLVEFHSILTLEQRNKFAEKIGKFRSKHGRM
jgi:Spy/CpxP family protein refolding chaperone